MASRVLLVTGGLMSANRLTIFDTTLRDGEQAPGLFDAHRREAEARATARGARRRHHRGRVSRSRRKPTPKRSARSRRRCRGRSLPALARCSPGRHRPRRGGARAGAAPPHPRLHRHVRPAPRAQAADDARGVPRRRRRRDPPRAPVYRRRAVFGGGCDAKRSGLPVPGDSRK